MRMGRSHKDRGQSVAQNRSQQSQVDIVKPQEKGVGKSHQPFVFPEQKVYITQSRKGAKKSEKTVLKLCDFAALRETFFVADSPP